MCIFSHPGPLRESERPGPLLELRLQFTDARSSCFLRLLLAPLLQFLFISNKVNTAWTKVFILSYSASKGNLICKRDA